MGAEYAVVLQDKDETIINNINQQHNKIIECSVFTPVTALCLRRQEVRFLQQTKWVGHTHHTCAHDGMYHGYALGLFQLWCLDANCSVDLSLEGSTLVQLLQPCQIHNPQTPILKHQ